MDPIVLFIILLAIVLGLLVAIAFQVRHRTRMLDAEIRFRDGLMDVLANNTNDIYLVINSDGQTVEYVSPNIERIIGTTVEEAKSDLYSIQTPTYLDGTQPTREELLAIPLEGSTSRESRRTHKTTGERIAFQETTYHIMIHGIDRMVVVLSDRTEERSKRAVLEESLAIARQANEAKTTFLSNISHDIRTPMNAIVGISELLDENADDPEFVRENTAKLKTSSRHLLNLINDVLDMNKIEGGNTSLDITEFSLAEMIDGVERVIEPQANARHQRLEVNIKGDVPDLVVGDRTRIAQILLNILSNSVKYTDEYGHIVCDVLCKRGVGSKSGTTAICFRITDNGIGMSEGFLKYVFDPFMREKREAVAEMQGTGLGMPIAKSLVDLMGGSIEVESNLGVGTVFTVDLTLKSKKLGDESSSSHEPIQLDISGMHFLLAEDVEINADVLRELLRLRNATCDIAENGKVASDMFITQPANTYDAILMDVQMPVMDGYEATKAIRSSDHEQAKSIPIIAMTANAFTEDVTDAMAAGMDAHLAKPATIAQLCETLGAVMGD